MDEAFVQYHANVARVRRMLQDYDPTLQILWNQRTGRWVVVEVRPNPRPVCGSLIGVRGVPETVAATTNLNFLFVCEYPDEHPLAGEPIPIGEWVLNEVKEYCKRKGEEHPDVAQKKRKDARAKEQRRIVRSMAEDNVSEIRKYWLKGARHFTTPSEAGSKN